MRLHAASIAFACLASSASAAVAQQRDTAETAPKGEEFSITQIKNEKWKGPNAPAAYIGALVKYSPTLTEKVKHAIKVNPDLNRKFGKHINAGKLCFSQFRVHQRKYERLSRCIGNQTGTAVATPSPGADSEYVLPVQIGTPPQTLPLNLDTGSADL
jgi:hypothetical protein